MEGVTQLLLGKNYPKTDIVNAVIGGVADAKGHTAERGIAEPAATA